MGNSNDANQTYQMEESLMSVYLLLPSSFQREHWSCMRDSWGRGNKKLGDGKTIDWHETDERKLKRHAGWHDVDPGLPPETGTDRLPAATHLLLYSDAVIDPVLTLQTNITYSSGQGEQQVPSWPCFPLVHS